MAVSPVWVWVCVCVGVRIAFVIMLKCCDSNLRRLRHSPSCRSPKKRSWRLSSGDFAKLIRRATIRSPNRFTRCGNGVEATGENSGRCSYSATARRTHSRLHIPKPSELKPYINIIYNIIYIYIYIYIYVYITRSPLNSLAHPT